MSRLLALFPLDVVLFPGARIALHIFEPRYQVLLADVLEGSGEFGLIPPGDDGGAPAEGSLGCVAHVATQQPIGDGRANIIVAGVRRFTLRRYVETEGIPYRVGLVDEFEDEEGATDIPADSAEALRRLADRCRAALAELTGLDVTEPWPLDAAALTFRVASVLPWEPTQARQLLAIRSAAQRADLLLRVLPQLVPELEARAAVHSRAGTNGKGHHSPDLGSGG
jgi:Lon protease-like protein